LIKPFHRYSLLILYHKQKKEFSVKRISFRVWRSLLEQLKTGTASDLFTFVIQFPAPAAAIIRNNSFLLFQSMWISNAPKISSAGDTFRRGELRE
jgi:hypothetical protein